MNNISDFVVELSKDPFNPDINFACAVEYEQLKQQFGSDPTKEQIAQLRQKTQEISRLRSQRSELRQQIDANAQAAAAEADKANQIASSAGIQGIDLAAEYQ